MIEMGIDTGSMWVMQWIYNPINNIIYNEQ